MSTTTIPTPATTLAPDVHQALAAGAGADPMTELHALWPPMLNADHLAGVEVGQILAILHACPTLEHVLQELFPHQNHPSTSPHASPANDPMSPRTEALLGELITRGPARYALTPLLALTHAATLRGEHDRATQLRSQAVECVFDRYGIDRLCQLRQILTPSAPLS
ncbi:hypothetical protein V3N95_11595 (plasmid) [Micrococcaceae bacterium Sec6.3]